MSEKTILKIGNKRFCAFCGKEITPSTEGQYTCQCSDAQQCREAERTAWQLQCEASKILNKAPKPKYGIYATIAILNDNSPSLTVNPDDEPSVCLE